MSIPERFLRNRGICPFHLPEGIVAALHPDIVLVQLIELPLVAPDGHMSAMYIAMQGFRCVMARRDGRAVELHFLILQQIAPHGLLADGEDHSVAGDGLSILLDGNRLVDGSPGTGILAAPVADASADRRERILFARPFPRT